MQSNFPFIPLHIKHHLLSTQSNKLTHARYKRYNPRLKNLARARNQTCSPVSVGTTLTVSPTVTPSRRPSACSKPTTSCASSRGEDKMILAASEPEIVSDTSAASWVESWARYVFVRSSHWTNHRGTIISYVSPFCLLHAFLHRSESLSAHLKSLGDNSRVKDLPDAFWELIDNHLSVWVG